MNQIQKVNGYGGGNALVVQDRGRVVAIVPERNTVRSADKIAKEIAMLPELKELVVTTTFIHLKNIEVALRQDDVAAAKTILSRLLASVKQMKKCIKS